MSDSQNQILTKCVKTRTRKNFFSQKFIHVRYITITKYGRGGVQGAMGLKIAKYDIAGLQIVIGLGLQSGTKILKK